MAASSSLLVTALAVGGGSAVGGIARFLIADLVARHQTGVFPWGTLSVNLAGSLAIGLLAAVLGPGGRWPQPPIVQHLVMAGVLGGFTTFSAFSLQTLILLRSGHGALAAVNVLGSVALCLLAAWVGLRLGTGWTR